LELEACTYGTPGVQPKIWVTISPKGEADLGRQTAEEVLPQRRRGAARHHGLVTEFAKERRPERKVLEVKGGAQQAHARPAEQLAERRDHRLI
jgi:hypothetical protein